MEDKNKYNFEVCLKKAERGDRNDQYNLGVLLLLRLLRLLPLLPSDTSSSLFSPIVRKHVITRKGMCCG